MTVVVWLTAELLHTASEHYQHLQTQTDTGTNTQAQTHTHTHTHRHTHTHHLKILDPLNECSLNKLL